jgi:hypothetical protein
VAGSAAIASVRKGLCARHDKSDGDSLYEANDVRWKNSGCATAFHRRWGAPVGVGQP